MSSTSPITTHALDTRLGQPAAGLGVVLERADADGTWKMLAVQSTNEGGRIGDLLPAGSLTAGHYRMTFDTGRYFQSQGVEHFYPRVSIEFEIRDPASHYHVPLVFSPFAYSTYRGS